MRRSYPNARRGLAWMRTPCSRHVTRSPAKGDASFWRSERWGEGTLGVPSRFDDVGATVVHRGRGGTTRRGSPYHS